MAFPSTPNNGEQVTLNYITYQYDTTNTAWYRVSTIAPEPIGNSAFVQANTATLNADSAGSFANGAFVQANTAVATSDSAGSFANGAFALANTASANADSAGSFANGAFEKANTISYPSAGIANSNGSAWSTSYSTTGTGSVLTLNTSPIITNPTVTNYIETPYVVNSGTALTIDLSNGTVQVVTLTGSPTITMPTAVAGKSFIMYMKTGAGSYTVTWSTASWPGASAPTVTSTASKMDIYSFFSDGTTWYGTTVGQNYTP